MNLNEIRPLIQVTQYDVEYWNGDFWVVEATHYTKESAEEELNSLLTTTNEADLRVVGYFRNRNPTGGCE